MAYSFRESDESVTAGLRRIALDQIDAGLVEIDDAELPLAERVHQVRKRCKKLRGLVRLVRPAFPGYASENAAFRDAARLLSGVRDAGALVETCDRVSARFADVLAEDALTPVREAIAARARAREQEDDVPDRMDAMREALREGRARAAGWTVTREDAKAVTGGLVRTYGRARDEMENARKHHTPEALHEWRKRVKYHWYHARLLKRCLPPVMEAHIALADHLADTLGDHHDLAVMEQATESLEDAASPETLAAFRGLMRQRAAMLEARAWPLGRVLLAETPKALGRRVGAYWSVWRAGEAPELPDSAM